MACSPEQIAAKKQQALERLRKNKETAAGVGATGFLSSPAKGTGSPIASGQFYGSPAGSSGAGILGNQKNLPGKPDNKAKQQPLKDNRIFSQPYTNKRDNVIPEKKKEVVPLALRTVCKCSMVSEDRFGVAISRFDDKITDAFRELPTRNFNRETKLWSFHVKDYEDFMKIMNKMQELVCVEELPAFIVKLFVRKKEEQRLDMSFLSSINPKLAGCLVDFQKEGVRFAIEKQGRCIIADEMGLGKTYQAIAVADFYRDDWPILICTTSSTKEVWAVKLQELLSRVSTTDIHMMDSTQTYLPNAAVYIATYTMMEKTTEQIAEKNCGIIIMDESHYLKNSKSKCTKAAMVLAKNARRVILLTGTPALSRPNELFSQLQMCDKSMFSYREYTKRYCDGKEGRFGWDASGKSNLTELNVLLTKKFMIRRTKGDVVKEISDKSRELIILDDALITRKDTFDDMTNVYGQSSGRKREEILLNFYSETAVAKVKAVCSYIKKVLKEQQKFIVFAYHRVMLEELSKCLDELNVSHIRIDGSTRSDVRHTMVQMFQTKPQYRVAVLSLKACNEGITLTAAQLVIFAELYWNPSTLAQGESRSHRIGQDGNVVVRYLLAKGTADDIIWQMINQKQNVLNKAGIGNEDFSNVASCTEITSTRKISEYFNKENAPNDVAAGPSSAPSNCDDDDLKKLLDDDADDLMMLLDDGEDDILAGIDC
ncbi:SWI/SNF-related matrix-associated actin-dependent regulator of chromatin subfamily A-like protein 1 [Lutzomyia longipalpis]|uniref:SWI/SNF-related matrix-associated actin-dependent regulator of chromatin subfamily A-like protein 1 n=1 Tax=Lutzomyia longipalpis TaxID=7200 RepID=UPI0024839799|nr:SWI/SNF-related matrix-associated actin-dependent regulator of chromatin subfamily A-like protein 1 [Lutzomyia longipalpis]